ncbi:MAG: HK97 gp10 family phage protein [Fusobacterium sp.]|uniref:HK97 gp10 family phage protein n=1 Tax=Fusobacterium sp. TaxID=68766 RepID=UPI002A75B4CB|nr:HK97 gp10 family phage protein [Fusobacterium sp.]MDY2980191.1 HK97 gp10 family phage protein [Fusobacterium sp.]
MNSFKDFEKDLLRLGKDLKSPETKKFLKKQGVKLKKRTEKIARTKVKEKTGNYLKSIKSGKVYEFNESFSSRVYSTAPHAHLIEYGHQIITKSGKVKGFKDGAYVFEEAKKSFEEDFTNAVDEYLDEIYKKNGF